MNGLTSEAYGLLFFSTLRLVPPGYEVRFFHLNSLYIFFTGCAGLYLLGSITFLVLSSLVFGKRWHLWVW